MHLQDSRNAMVCVINATGVIQMVSKPLSEELGYSRGELDGKNVSVMMPQPFSGKHNSFIKNYLTSGKPKILDRVREVSKTTRHQQMGLPDLARDMVYDGIRYMTNGSKMRMHPCVVGAIVVNGVNGWFGRASR